MPKTKDKTSKYWRPSKIRKKRYSFFKWQPKTSGGEQKEKKKLDLKRMEEETLDYDGEKGRKKKGKDTALETRKETIQHSMET